MWKWTRKKGTTPELEAIHRLEEATRKQSGLFGEAIQEHIGKLGRLHYKHSQEVQGRLEQITERLDKVVSEQEQRTAERQCSERLERQLQGTTEQLIAWLDDLDAALVRLQGEEAWRSLLQQWRSQLKRTLTTADIHELQVLGTSFDPRWCESVGTTPPTPEASTVPYEIMEVVKRGFVTGDGKLLRKSQVITLEVNPHHVE
jgi:molecular chaperone GrpE (heat shock protein)